MPEVGNTTVRVGIYNLFFFMFSNYSEKKRLQVFNNFKECIICFSEVDLFF